jgi:hypothetical protein
MVDESAALSRISGSRKPLVHDDHFEVIGDGHIRVFDGKNPPERNS